MLGNAFYDLGSGWSEKNYTQWIDIILSMLLHIILDVNIIWKSL